MPADWVGRFAPTPTGPLHFGSLVAALASYLVARHHGGRWLVRMEDLDRPREVPGSAEQILHTLEAFGFEWDAEVIYQSQRTPVYSNALQGLIDDGLVYACRCSRKEVLARSGGIYDAFCSTNRLKSGEKLTLAGDQTALRIRFNRDCSRFYDHILGDCQLDSAAHQQDFVIRRRDGLFAYQLAVVVDDLAQQVNHVVRGADILESTPRQNFLYQCLGAEPPQYFHLPLALDASGSKLSKSRFSAEIRSDNASKWLLKALIHLRQTTPPELIDASPKEILDWSVSHWRLSSVGQSPVMYPDC